MVQEELLELTGEVESVLFRNEDNGYTVIEILSDEEITAVGIMPEINPGEEVRLIGNFKNHPTYGSQFSVTTCERQMPSTTAGILKYLSTGAIKGVGPVMAQRLIEEFGEATLDVIKNNPERVSKIKGFSKRRANDMSSQLKQVMGIRELIIYLEKFGISPHDSVIVWKNFGSSSTKYIESNPYILCSDEINIPFDVVDNIAKSLNHNIDKKYRIRAGISHVLIHNKNNGHTCLPKNKLIETACSFLEIDFEKGNEILNEMLLDNTLIEEIVNEESFVFIPSLFQSEIYAAARLKMLLRFPAPQIPKVKNQIKQIEIDENIKYAEMQKQAISMALNTGLLVLTGGPGTGKTTTLNAIIKILKNNGQKVALAAPTGRAAQRMSDLTGCEAKTIHRLLEVAWDLKDKPVFNKNEENLLNCDALILDELSMVDSQLFDSVTKALPMGCRLILVGDSNQLPSVGAGNVLADLIDSKTIPVVTLTEIFRQSLESLIITNAHKIVHGEMPELNIKDKDFFFLPSNNIMQISNTIVDLCSRRLPNSYGYSVTEDIQVLSPGRRGALGANDLNKHLQDSLNPSSKNKQEITLGFSTYRLGDKVMQIKNNYNISWTKDNGETGEGIFNGDIGFLTEINKSAKTLKIVFDDKVAMYNSDDAMDLDLAYATTIHKSQGNEFTAVIMPVYGASPKLYYRNLLYTGVTRAKKLIILVGSERTISQMVNNNRRTKRYSGLKDFLQRDF